MSPKGDQSRLKKVRRLQKGFMMRLIEYCFLHSDRKLTQPGVLQGNEKKKTLNARKIKNYYAGKEM